MKQNILLVALLLILVVSVTQGSSNPSCPLKTPEQWRGFLERYASEDFWVGTCPNGSCNVEHYDFVNDKIQSMFDNCKSSISENPTIAKCTDRYRRFVRVWLAQHDDESYGFTVKNPAYLAEQEAPDKPAGMMRPPDVVLAALPARETVEEAARKAGLKYLTHDSGLAGIRTFVLSEDPKGRYDQWLLLNLSDAKAKVGSVEPMSVIAVEKKDASGRRLPQVRLHFRDYFIERGKDGKYRARLHKASDGKCYSCHANGVRQLIDRRTPVLESKPVRGEKHFDEAGLKVPRDFSFRRLWQFNERLRSYGTPDWDGKIILSDLGPTIGAAQGCVDCHDGKSRGRLTVFTSTSTLQQKMVHELNMPYDSDLPKRLERLQMKRDELTKDEISELARHAEAQKALFRDFENSRSALLRKWLLEIPCGS